MDDLLNFIEGDWMRGTGGEPRSNTNPARATQVLNRAQAGSPPDALAAIDAAERAFKAWRDTPAPERGKIVQKAAQILESRRQELARALTQEEGKYSPRPSQRLTMVSPTCTSPSAKAPGCMARPSRRPSAMC